MADRHRKREREEDKLREKGEARGAVGPGPEEDEGNGIEAKEGEEYELVVGAGAAAAAGAAGAAGEGAASPAESQRTDPTFVNSLGQAANSLGSGSDTGGSGSESENSSNEYGRLFLKHLRNDAAAAAARRAAAAPTAAAPAAPAAAAAPEVNDRALREEAREIFSRFPVVAAPAAVVKNGYQILAAGPHSAGNPNPHYQKTLYTMILCWLLDGLGHDQIYGSRVNRTLLLKVFLDAHPDLEPVYKTELKTHVLNPKSDAAVKAIIISALKDLAVTLGIPMEAKAFSYDTPANNEGSTALVNSLEGRPGVLSVDSLRGNYKNVLSAAANSATLYFGKSAAVLGDPASFSPDTAAGTGIYQNRIRVVTQVGDHIALGATGMPMSTNTTMRLLAEDRVQKSIKLNNGAVITATFSNKGVSITQVQKLAEFLIAGDTTKGFSLSEDGLIQGPELVAGQGPDLVIQLDRPFNQFSLYQLVAVCVGLKTDGDFGIGRNMASLPNSPVTYRLPEPGGGTLGPAVYTDVHMSIDIIASIFGRVFASKVGLMMHSERMEVFSGAAVQRDITEQSVLELLRNIRRRIPGNVRNSVSTAPGRRSRPPEGYIVATEESLQTISKGDKEPGQIAFTIREIKRRIDELGDTAPEVREILGALIADSEELPGEVRAFLQELAGENRGEVLGSLITDENKGIFEEFARTLLRVNKARFDRAAQTYFQYEATHVRYDLTNVGQELLAAAIEYANSIIDRTFDGIGVVGLNTVLIREVLKSYHRKVAELNANENLRSGQRFIDPVSMLTRESFPELNALYEQRGIALSRALIDLDQGAMASHAELLRIHSRNIDGDHEARFMMRNLTNLFVKFGFTKLVSSQVAGYLGALLTGPLFRTGTAPETIEDITEDEALQSDDESVPDQNYANFQRLYGEAITEVSGNKDLATGKILNIIITLVTDGKVPDLEARMPPLRAAAAAALGVGAAEMLDEAAGGAGAAGGAPAPEAGGMSDNDAAGAAGGAPGSRRSGRFRPNYPNSIPREQVNEFKGTGGGFLPFLTKVKYDGKNHIYEYGKNKYILVKNPDGFYTAKPSQGGGSRKYRNRKTYKKVKKSNRSKKSRKINKHSRKST